MQTIKSLWVQTFPSKPTLTAATLPPQTGKVIIITGATSGLGFELARVLYNAGATVYIGARNEAKAKATIETITSTSPSSSTGSTSTPNPGTLHFLPLDLADLRTIAPFVQSFLSLSSRLDILFNNAGVASIPPSTRTAQNLEPHLGTNCAAPYLLTQLLSPLLTSTAQNPSTPRNSVRVIWTSSMLVDALAPRSGIRQSDLDPDAPNPNMNVNYALSKTGNWFLADRLAKQLGEQGVVSVTQNPGNIYTPIFDNAPRLAVWLSRPIYYTPRQGVNTILWAGLSESVTVERGGGYVIPFGRWHPFPRRDLLEAMRDKEEGGDEAENEGRGYAKAFEEWCEKVTREFR
ncbi:uncharacterized protein DSM5745_07109 [Aspergillus mulundensis]|uniref:Short-chain dehydrogenase n=1 Tax=Aspergillus mulundensis TaxID=1810919 RepID=A0A3D8RK65_9EURO|nr:hypothetical protein DSM5745_07109 [Aspergillus mulundensis]RDW74447.1 hypothetical protein DSM5745_07109 [Aspergillus mulundensis]